MKPFFTSSFWITSILFTLVQRFSLFLFAFAGFFILTHFLLDKEQIGIYALFNTIITMMEYVKMGLLRNALIKFFHDSRFSGKLKQIQSTSLLINVLYSILVIFFLLIAGDWLSDLLHTRELTTLLHLSIGLIILQIPFNHCEIVQQVNMQYKITFYAYLFRQGLLFVFIAGNVLYPDKALAIYQLVVAQIAALAVAAAYFLTSSKKYLHTRFYFDRDVFRQLLKYGKFVFGTALLSHIYKFADHFVTAYTIGDARTGKIYVSYYNVVSRIAGVLDIPFMAVADVLFPVNAQAMATEGIEKVKYYFEQMVGTLTALIIPVSLFIAFIPGLVIKIIAGPAYMEAATLLRITMLFAFFRPFYSQFGYTMDSIGKPRINFIVNFFFLIITLGCTYLGIRLFDLEGAVYATTLIMVIGCIVFYFILRKTLNLELKNIFRYIILTYIGLFKYFKTFFLKKHGAS